MHKNLGHLHPLASARPQGFWKLSRSLLISPIFLISGLGMISLDLSIYEEKIDVLPSIALLVLLMFDPGALDRQRSISLHRSISVE